MLPATRLRRRSIGAVGEKIFGSWAQISSDLDTQSQPQNINCRNFHVARPFEHRNILAQERFVDPAEPVKKSGKAWGVKSRTRGQPGRGWRAKLRAILWAMANQVAMALTFSVPRTVSCWRPRLRAWALTHSADAPLCLSISLAAGVPIRWRHSA